MATALLLAFGLRALAAPPPASAQAPADPIVAALQQSPVYVDPAISAALPPDQREQLIAGITAGKVPVFLVLVPLVKGDAWGGSSRALATVVHDRLGRDGVYVTLDENSNGDIEAHEWPSDQHESRYAAWTTDFEDNLRDAGLYPKLARAIELINSGGGRAAYDAATEAIDRRYRVSGGGSSRPASGDGGGDDGGSAAGWVGLLLGVAVLGGGAAALRFRRRRPATGSADSFRLPRKVFVAARQADEAELRDRACAELLHFGELLDRDDFKPEGAEAQADLQRALDAYFAAGKVADAAARPVDWVGVLVLVDTGRDAYAAARARDAGERPDPPSALCFFNPLHGDAARTIDWRPLGQRARLQIPACPTCVKAVKTRRAPEVLTDRTAGHDIPYFEVEAPQSLWAATGYGTLRNDLIPSILRGDFTRTRDR